jgi:Protein of unknown function (DUF732)
MTAAAPGGADTTVLDTSAAAAPELAWSLEDDDEAIHHVTDLRKVAGHEAFSPDLDDAGERYSWWEVWRNAALLVLVAAALAVLAAVLTSVTLEDHEPAPAVAPPAAAVKDPSHDDVCTAIAGGTTPEQLEAQMVAPQQNSSLTLDQARDYVNTAIKAYCP